MYYDDSIMSKLREHFGFLAVIDLTQWIDWLCKDETDKGEYWKGLEIFLAVMEMEFGVGPSA